MKTEDKIIEEPLGCNCDLKRGFCGEITFANKIILCDDCTFKLIEKVGNLEKALQSERARIKEEIKKLTFKCLEDYCYQGAPSKAEVQRVKLKAEGFDKCKLELLKVIDNSQQKNIDSEKVGVNPSGLVKLPSADKIVEKK